MEIKGSKKKYTIGDKVRVRKGLVNKWYGRVYCARTMVELKGKVLTIEAAGICSYLVEENCYLWTDEMLETVSPALEQRLIKADNWLEAAKAEVEKLKAEIKKRDTVMCAYEFPLPIDCFRCDVRHSCVNFWHCGTSSRPDECPLKITGGENADNK